MTQGRNNPPRKLAETTHIPRPKRLSPKVGWNDPKSLDFPVLKSKQRKRMLPILNEIISESEFEKLTGETAKWQYINRYCG